MKDGEPEADTASRSGVPHMNTVGVKGRNCVAAAAVLWSWASRPVNLCAFVSGLFACVKCEVCCIRTVEHVTGAGSSLPYPVLFRKTQVEVTGRCS